MNMKDTLISVLKQSGLRLTPQRIAICQMLAETDEHPTATQIYQALKPDYPSLSLATVYNTLEALVGLGVVNALGHAGDDQVHYDADTAPHVNLACISCHKIVDVPSEHVQHLQGEISNTSGFRLLGARVLYYGVCPECQAKQAAAPHQLPTMNEQ
ncbi:MAG: Fur family transcriptional regulator [Anaerolineales bacterium]